MAHRGSRHYRRISLALAFTLLLLVICVGWPSAAHVFASGMRSCGADQSVSLPSTSASGPRITLTHPTGPIGMSELISGTGWPADTQVTIDLDVPQPDGTFAVELHAIALVKGTSASGTFSIPGFQVPYPGGCVSGATGDPGTIVDFVASTPDNKLVAKAAFTYTAQPTLLYNGDPNPLPGAIITVQGTQWEAHERVIVTITQLSPAQQSASPGTSPQPLPIDTIHVQADGHGMFSASYQLSDTLEPRTMLLIQVTGNGPLYGTVTAPQIQLVVAPAIRPTVTLDRSSGTVTDAITVRGAHWVPGDSIEIMYCRGTTPAHKTGGLPCDPNLSAALATVTVDQGGAFAATVYLPSNARIGPITIEVVVPNDTSGLTYYIQSAIYQIVPPPLPWSRVHPRLAFLLNILRPAVPALALALALLAIYVWRRRRTSRLRAAETPQPAPTPTHA